MKKQFHMIGLSLLLALVLAADVWLLWGPFKKPEGEETPSAQATPAAEETLYQTEAWDDMAWDEEALRKVNNQAALLKYGDRIVYRSNRTFYDVDTAEALFTLPEELIPNEETEEWTYGFNFSKNLYAIRYDWVREEMVVRRCDLSNLQTAEEIVMEDWDGLLRENTITGYKWAFFGTLMADERYIYFETRRQSDGGSLFELWVYTFEGKLHQKFVCGDYAIDGAGTLYLMTSGPNTLSKIKIHTLEYEESILLDENGAREFNREICLDGANGLLYLENDRYIYTRATEDLSEIKTVMNRDRSMLLFESADFMDAHSFELNAEGQMYFKQQGTICRYTPKDVPDIPYTLTITAPYYDSFMVQALTLYERADPERRVLYQYAYYDRETFIANYEKDNYFEKENLNLLAGQVGDLFMQADFYPYLQDRLESDLFVDLSAFAEKNSLTCSLDQAALDGLCVNGQLRLLPLAMDYSYCTVNTVLAEQLGIDLDWQNISWGEVLELYDDVTAQGYTLFCASSESTPQTLLSHILNVNLPALVDRVSGTIDLQQPWFEGLMTRLGQLWNAPGFYTQAGGSYVDVAENALIRIDGRTRNKESLMGYYCASHMEDGQHCTIIPVFTGEQGGGRLGNSAYLYAIPAWSQRQETAEDFLAFVLGQEIMARKVLIDRQVNTHARFLEERSGMSEEIDSETAMAYMNEMEAVYASVDQLYSHGEIGSLLLQHIGRYIDGTTTLDEALSAAEEAIWLSLNA